MEKLFYFVSKLGVKNKETTASEMKPQIVLQVLVVVMRVGRNRELVF